MNHLKFLREQASKGGKAGTGKAKVRGDSKHYARLAKLKKAKGKKKR